MLTSGKLNGKVMERDAIRDHLPGFRITLTVIARRLNAAPVTVQRRVSQRGQIMVATQRIQVGMIHARKIVTVTSDDHTFRLDIDGQTVATVPRTSGREIHLYKAYDPAATPSALMAERATVHLMNTPPGPAAARNEFDLMGALFSPAGSADPHVILRGSPLPGCQYPFVRDVLRDPRFAAPTIRPPRTRHSSCSGGG